MKAFSLGFLLMLFLLSTIAVSITASRKLTDPEQTDCLYVGDVRIGCTKREVERS